MKNKVKLVKKYFSLEASISIIISLFLLFSLVYFFAQKYIEPKVSDFLTAQTTKESSSEVINVAIDDKSIEEVGRWPWKRSLYTDIFEYLENEGNAKAVVFDSVITTYGDKNTDNEFFKRFKKLDKTIVGIYFSTNYDNQFIKEGKLKKHYSIDVHDLRDEKEIQKSEYVSFSNILDEMFLENHNMGSVISSLDGDEVIRKVEPIIYYKGNYFPSMGILTLIKYYDLDKFNITKNEIVLSNDTTEIKVPLVKNGNNFYTKIRWYKPFSSDNFITHKTYSAYKILNSYNQIKKGQKPEIDPAIFKDKIVVVGATAFALNDIKTTPLGTNYPGVDIQSTFIDNLINQDFLTEIPLGINILILAASIVLPILFVTILTPVFSVLLSVLMAFTYFYLCLQLYLFDFAPLVSIPISFILASLGVGFVLKSIVEKQDKEKIRLAMDKYMSHSVACEVLDKNESVQLGGKKAEVSVLFSDIRDFTSIAEILSPEEITDLLNEYFTVMVPIVKKHNGTINKFVGDALLAVFGEPAKDPQHPLKAVLAGWEMTLALKELNEKWKQEGRAQINIGIGINTGIAFLGNIGSEDRLEYTVIGDTVNVASRIESFNRTYNTKLLIGEAVYEKVRNFVDTIEISGVKLKGRSVDINIYEVIGIKQ